MNHEPSPPSRRFPRKPRRRSRSDIGFTLVELLVASAVFACLLVILTGVIGSVTNISSRASAKVDAIRMGREIFDLMQKDITQAASTRPASGSSVALQFCVNPPDTQIPAIYKNPCVLFWQAPVSRDRSWGNLAVLGYFVQRPSAQQSQLRRVMIEPSDTVHYQIYGSSGTWLTPATIAPFVGGASSSSLINTDRGWVADGVLGLWIRCLDANGVPITVTGANAATAGYTFDSRLGYRSGTGTNAIVRMGVNALPSFVDVGLICVLSRDLGRIDNLPAVPSGSSDHFDADIGAYLTSFETGNPKVKSAVSLIRRFRISGGN